VDRGRKEPARETNTALLNPVCITLTQCDPFVLSKRIDLELVSRREFG